MLPLSFRSVRESALSPKEKQPKGSIPLIPTFNLTVFQKVSETVFVYRASGNAPVASGGTVKAPRALELFYQISLSALIFTIF